jgi:tRNA U34 5-carboxymethylaminomethyl modifying GTPase MnmE/TrmE
MKPADIQAEFQKLHNVLTRFKADLPSNDLLELETFFKDYENNIQSAIESGRNLRIAIVGQMKAGKSSFLNALLLMCCQKPRHQ